MVKKGDGRREIAWSRAEALLVSQLDDLQRHQYHQHAYFDITGSLGTRYRIKSRSVYNVLWLTPRGMPGGLLCAAPSLDYWGIRLPIPDMMLGQMLSLITDERAFLAKANLDSPGRWPPCVRHPHWRSLRGFCRDVWNAVIRNY